jgi:SMODS and SLOG-associating 2TM effector domain 6
MNKDDLLKHLAEMGYNVGFGAKKHFATYDITDKVPGFIGLVSMVFGTYALVFDELSAKFLSASFIVLGIIGLYISFYDSKKDDYEKTGIFLTQLFNELRRLYRSAKVSDDNMLPGIEQEFKEIEDKYYANSKSKQILFSDWYAHYKFFWQQQIGWIEEQKKFTLFRDKVPLSFSITVFLSLIVFLFWALKHLNFLCYK